MRLFFLILMLAVGKLNAQDSTCQKLMNLTKIRPENKYSSRCISKTSDNTMTSITETDTFLNIHTSTTLNFSGTEIKTEIIKYFDKIYAKNDEKPWQLMGEASAKLEAQKLLFATKEKLNMPNQNCKQLEDTIIDNRKYLVFTTEMTIPIAKEGMPKMPKTKIKMWLSEQGLAHKMENEMEINGKTIIYFSKFEYDANILIQKPID